VDCGLSPSARFVMVAARPIDFAVLPECQIVISMLACLQT